MAMRVGMNCPHCGSRAQIRKSQQLTKTMREAYFLCLNLVCGHSWLAHIEAVRTIAPSGIPDPTINLPVSEREEIARIHDILNSGKQRSIFDDERK